MIEKAEDILKKKTGNSDNSELIEEVQRELEWQEILADNCQEFQDFYQKQVDISAPALADTWIENFKQIDLDITIYKYDVVRDISYKNEVDEKAKYLIN